MSPFPFSMSHFPHHPLAPPIISTSHPPLHHQGNVVAKLNNSNQWSTSDIHSDCDFTYKIWILFALARKCLPGFFTLMDNVDSCEIRSDFTCKMRSEIDVFEVKCEIDDIPYHYVRFFVRIVICIVGKLSICNRFWIEEKSLRNFYMRKHQLMKENSVC